MASGFFLGGAAEGATTALEQARKDALLELQNKQFGLEGQKFGLQQQESAQNYGLNKQRVDIAGQHLALQQKGQAFEQQRNLLADADAHVAGTMKIVADTVAQARATGADPQTIFKTVQPLVDNAANIYTSVNKSFPNDGRNPGTLYAQVNAMLTQPSAIERGKVEGQALAAKDEASGFKFQQIGEDAYGNKKYGFVNPATQKIIDPQTPALPAGQGAPQSTDGAPPPDAKPDIMHGDEFLRTLPSANAATVKAIAEGRMAPPTSFAASKPYWQKTLADVAQYEPGFDLTTWASRQQARKEFNSGGPNAPSGQITAGNTAIQHLKQLSDAAEELKNGGWTGVNWIRNEYRTKSGSPLVTNYNNVLSKFVEEATKFYRGAGGTEADIQRDINNLSPNGSPEQLHQGIATAAHLMASKIEALQSRWKNALGPGAGDFPILTEKSGDGLKVIDARSGKSADGSSTGGLPKPPAGFQLVP